MASRSQIYKLAQGAAGGSLFGPSTSLGVYGDKQVIAMMKTMPDKLIKRHLKAAMRKAFGITQRKAAANARQISNLPARTANYNRAKGFHADPIRMSTNKNAPAYRPSIDVGAARSYFHLNILEGYWPTKGPYKMPKGEKPADKPMVFQGTNSYAGQVIVTKKVKSHPPPAPKPWLRPALESTAKQVIDKLRDEVRDKVHKHFREMGAK